MHIFIFEDSSKSFFGGGQKVTLDTVRVFKNLGYEITFFNTVKGSEFNKEMMEFSDNFVLLLGHGKFVSGGINRLIYRCLEFAKFPLIALINIFTIVRLLQDKQIDEVIAYSTTRKSVVYAAVISKLMGVRCIHHAHLVENGRLRGLTRLLMANVNAVLCVSNAVAESISLSNTFVIYNKLSKTENSRYFGTVDKIRLRNVFFVGSLIEEKGLLDFLELSDLLKHQGLEFYVCGRGPLEGELNGRNVTYLGFRSDMNEILTNEVDILVLPSLIPEACPMVVLEALANRKVVLTTNIGGQAELLGEDLNFLTFGKGEMETAKNILKNILNDVNYRKKVISNIDKRAAFFESLDYERAIAKAIEI